MGRGLGTQTNFDKIGSQYPIYSDTETQVYFFL
jgi:hypothetical protein